MNDHDDLSRLSATSEADPNIDHDLSCAAIEEMMRSWRSIRFKPTWIFFSPFAVKDESLLFKTKDEDCLLCHESMHAKLLETAPHLARFEINRTKFMDFLSKWVANEEAWRNALDICQPAVPSMPLRRTDDDDDQ